MPVVGALAKHMQRWVNVGEGKMLSDIFCALRFTRHIEVAPNVRGTLQWKFLSFKCGTLSSNCLNDPVCPCAVEKFDTKRKCSWATSRANGYSPPLVCHGKRANNGIHRCARMRLLKWIYGERCMSVWNAERMGSVTFIFFFFIFPFFGIC